MSAFRKRSFLVVTHYGLEYARVNPVDVKGFVSSTDATGPCVGFHVSGSDFLPCAAALGDSLECLSVISSTVD